jgi:hypothetical protein
MNWIQVDDKLILPRDESIFLVVWKGRISLCQYCSDENRFYIIFEPTYHDDAHLDETAEKRISHWMPLPHNPTW